MEIYVGDERCGIRQTGGAPGRFQSYIEGGRFSGDAIGTNVMLKCPQCDLTVWLYGVDMRPRSVRCVEHGVECEEAPYEDWRGPGSISTLVGDH